MNKTRLAILSGVVLFLSLVIVAVGSGSSASTVIRRSLFAGSSGSSMVGDLRLTGSMGQPIIGSSAVGSTGLRAGYWHAPGHSIHHVYLGIITGTFWGNDHEDEPNNSFQQANGPIQFDKVYTGSPNDNAPGVEYDIFYFYLSANNGLVIQLNNFPSGQRLQLYDGSEALQKSVFSESNTYDMTISEALPAGKYYIVAFAAAGHPATSGDYTLQVTVD